MAQDMENIAFIARNIPAPNIEENDIVLKLAQRLQSHFGIQIYFPAEVMPPAFLCPPPWRPVASLKKKFNYRGFEYNVLRYFRLPTLKFSYMLLNSARWLSRGQFHELSSYALTHAHYLLPDGYLSYMAKELYGIPYVVTVRQGDLNKMGELERDSVLRHRYEKVLWNADAVIALSAVHKTALADMGVCATLIPHAVDRRALNAVERRGEADKCVRIITVANLIERKNVDWCLRALQEYRGSVEVQYSIVGDGPQAQKLRKIEIQNPNVTVRFLGRIDYRQVLKMYARHDLFVLPSFKETFGMVYLEAIGSGCATLALRGTGIDGLFNDGVEAIYAKPLYEEFRQIFWNIIESPDLRKILSVNGMTRVRDQFCWDAITPKYIELYGKVEAMQQLRGGNERNSLLFKKDISC
jgi:glycosyltransferase involved in cell wall biosynthesis